MAKKTRKSKSPSTPAHKAPNDSVMVSFTGNQLTGGYTESVNKTVIGDDKVGEIYNDETKRVEGVPAYAKEPKEIESLTHKQKKDFLSLYERGARTPEYNAWLGVAQSTIVWLKEHVDEIKEEVNKIEKEKELSIEEQRRDARVANEYARVEEKLPEPVEGEIPPKTWKVARNQEKWFWQDARIRNLEWMARKYYGEWTKGSIVAVNGEIERLEKKFG